MSKRSEELGKELNKAVGGTNKRTIKLPSFAMNKEPKEKQKEINNVISIDSIRKEKSKHSPKTKRTLCLNLGNTKSNTEDVTSAPVNTNDDLLNNEINSVESFDVTEKYAENAIDSINNIDEILNIVNETDYIEDNYEEEIDIDSFYEENDEDIVDEENNIDEQNIENVVDEDNHIEVEEIVENEIVEDIVDDVTGEVIEDNVIEEVNNDVVDESEYLEDNYDDEVINEDYNDELVDEDDYVDEVVDEIIEDETTVEDEYIEENYDDELVDEDYDGEIADEDDYAEENYNNAVTDELVEDKVVEEVNDNEDNQVTSIIISAPVLSTPKSTTSKDTKPVINLNSPFFYTPSVFEQYHIDFSDVNDIEDEKYEDEITAESNYVEEDYDDELVEDEDDYIEEDYDDELVEDEDDYIEEDYDDELVEDEDDYIEENYDDELVEDEDDYIEEDEDDYVEENYDDEYIEDEDDYIEEDYDDELVEDEDDYIEEDYDDELVEDKDDYVEEDYDDELVEDKDDYVEEDYEFEESPIEDRNELVIENNFEDLDALISQDTVNESYFKSINYNEETPIKESANSVGILVESPTSKQKVTMPKVSQFKSIFKKFSYDEAELINSANELIDDTSAVQNINTISEIQQTIENAKIGQDKKVTEFDVKASPIATIPVIENNIEAITPAMDSTTGYNLDNDINILNVLTPESNSHTVIDNEPVIEDSNTNEENSINDENNINKTQLEEDLPFISELFSSLNDTINSLSNRISELEKNKIQPVDNIGEVNNNESAEIITESPIEEVNADEQAIISEIIEELDSDYVFEDKLDDIAEETPIIEDVSNEIVNEAPIIENTSNEIIDESPIIENASNEIVDESPIVENGSNEFINEESIIDENPIEVIDEDLTNILNEVEELENSISDIITDEVSNETINEEPVIQDIVNEVVPVDQNISNEIINESSIENGELPTIEEIHSEEACAEIENIENEIENILSDVMASDENIKEKLLTELVDAENEISKEHKIDNEINNEEITSDFLKVIDTLTQTISQLEENNIANNTVVEKHHQSISDLINAELNIDNTKKNEVDSTPISNKEVIETSSDNENDESSVCDNKKLIISEENQKVYLPYTIKDIMEKLNNTSNGYQTVQDVIDEEYTVPLSEFKMPIISRFKEAYRFMRVKEKSSVYAAVDLALELMFNSIFKSSNNKSFKKFKRIK